MSNEKQWNIQNILINRIGIAKSNVRTSDKEKGIDELAENISRYGLLQPIVVYKEANRFKLVIGQRRHRALKQLNARDPDRFDTILARILPQEPDEERAKIMSLSENIQRVELNRKDIVEAISFLFDKHSSVSKVAELLGIHPLSVSSYLPIVNAPEKIKEMYFNKEITRADTKRLMLIAPDDEKKMLQLAQDMPHLTKDEKERLVDAAARIPGASPRKLLKEARRRRTTEKIVVPLTVGQSKALDKAAGDVNLSREEIAKNALVEWLTAKGYYKE